MGLFSSHRTASEQTVGDRYHESTPVGIEIHGLRKRYGGKAVLDGVELSVPAGQTLVIIGGSGQGKSVLLRHIIGLSVPDEGTILVGGLPSTDPAMRARYRVAMIFQSSALFNSMTVGENVGLWLVEHRVFRTRREVETVIEERLAMVGLEGTAALMPAELSGGMKKRVAIARALAMNPDLILYDEPTSELDPLVSDTISKVIVDLKARLRLTSVIVSHDLRMAFAIADRIAMIHEGRIIADGPPDAIRAAPNPILQRFIAHQSSGRQDARA
ncbi:MAG TPA: ATP-binding cassette domain-containing protein [Nitrospiria bacterium]|nr:ATP-binding cassette domain-containing protein [Nitrospiria bacterium]